MLDGTKQALQMFGERYEVERGRIELVRAELSAAFDGAVKAAPTEVDEGAGAAARFLSSAKRLRQTILDVEKEQAKGTEKPKTADGRTVDNLDTDAETTRKEIKKKKEQLSQSISDNPGLVDFLQSLRSQSNYREHLGLLDTAQHHLKELSRILLYTAKNRTVVNDATAIQGADTADEVRARSLPFVPFERGSPRIVLVIDDLDRCPPRQVVTVLEAAQLLMKTELFVVLIAIDLRYITRALEKVYRGILAHEHHPTGLDYIEKIIQLPYRVREVSPEQLSGFFAENLDVAAATGASEDAVVDDDTGGPQGQQQVGRLVEIPSPEVKKETLQLSAPEFKNLVDTCRYLSLSPRSAKRITNVYKIWKLIWHRRGFVAQDSLETRVMVALLALSTVRPRLVRHGLLEMNAGVRFGSKQDPGLESLFREFAERLREPLHIRELLTDSRLLPDSFKLSQLSVPNLNLLTSFSFVGDDESSDPEEATGVKVTRPGSDAATHTGGASREM